MSWTAAALGRLRSLHVAGLSDREIGEKLALSARAVGHQRRRLGLAANKGNSRELELDWLVLRLTLGGDSAGLAEEVNKVLPELGIGAAPDEE